MINNNDVFRRIRYILNIQENQITKIFKHVDKVVTETQVKHWLKREADSGYSELPDDVLIDFLDALIIEKRGKKDGPTIRYKQKLNNNLIIMKIKIAFHLKSEDVLEIMDLAEFKISKHELSALFRKPDHKHYRVCKNQILRKFMKGLQIKYRTPKQPPSTQKPAVQTTENVTKTPNKDKLKLSTKSKNNKTTTTTKNIWKIPKK